jgi:hypothetical protein
LLLPLRLYTARFPAAKSLVGLPLARYQGKLFLNGESVEIADWTGSPVLSRAVCFMLGICIFSNANASEP